VRDGREKVARHRRRRDRRQSAGRVVFNVVGMRGGENRRGRRRRVAGWGGVTGDHNGFVSIDVRDSGARASR